MAFRCPDCNKFVSVEQSDPEFEPEIDGNQITGACRLVLACAECGTELAEASPETAIEFEDEHDHAGNDAVEFSVVDYSASPTERYEGSGRARRHLYGAEVAVTVGCTCGWTASLRDLVEEQAAYFDSLV